MIPGSHRLGFEREELVLSGSGVCSLLLTVLSGRLGWGGGGDEGEESADTQGACWGSCFPWLLTEQSWEASQATAWVTCPCSFTDTNGALVPCCLAGCWGQRSSVSREPLLKASGSGVSSPHLLAFLRGWSHFRIFSS